jgi:hypothetical protein
VAKAQASIDPLSRYAQEGFVNVDEQLVYAMQDAGLTWGGDWKGSKDFMHFDSK